MRIGQSIVGGTLHHQLEPSAFLRLQVSRHIDIYRSSYLHLSSNTSNSWYSLGRRADDRWYGPRSIGTRTNDNGQSATRPTPLLEQVANSDEPVRIIDHCSGLTARLSSDEIVHEYHNLTVRYRRTQLRDLK